MSTREAAEDRFREELSLVLEHKGPISKSRIQALLGIALDNVHLHRSLVVRVVEFMENAPSHQKLNCLYIIDAICRQSAKRYGREDVYCGEFLRYFDRTAAATCDCQSANVESVKKLLGIWEKGNVFPAEDLRRMRDTFEARASHSVSFLDDRPPPPPPQQQQEQQDLTQDAGRTGGPALPSFLSIGQPQEQQPRYSQEQFPQTYVQPQPQPPLPPPVGSSYSGLTANPYPQAQGHGYGDEEEKEAEYLRLVDSIPSYEMYDPTLCAEGFPPIRVSPQNRKTVKSTTLYIGGVASQTVADAVRAVCQECGTVLQFNCMCPGKNIAFSTFERREEAERAKARLSGALYERQTLQVKWAKGKTQYISFDNNTGEGVVAEEWEETPGAKRQSYAQYQQHQQRQTPEEHGGQRKKSKWDVM